MTGRIKGGEEKKKGGGEHTMQLIIGRLGRRRAAAGLMLFAIGVTAAFKARGKSKKMGCLLAARANWDTRCKWPRFSHHLGGGGEHGASEARGRGSKTEV